MSNTEKKKSNDTDKWVDEDVRPGPDSTVVPEDNAWLPSRLVYHWAGPIFRKASNAHTAGKGFDHDDLLPLIDEDTGSSIRTRFNLGLEKYNVKVGAIENKDLKQKA